jgi:hypothetical protein
VPPDSPVQQENKRLQRSTAPNPNGLLPCQASDNEQCHVRCTTRLSGVPIDSNGWNSGWGYKCDGTSQVIRPTYSCPCLTDIRHPVDVPKSLDKFGIFPYLTRNVSPVLQTLQNIGDKEMRKRLHNLHLF